MVARLEADGGRLAQMPVQSKNPLVMLGNAARLTDLIRKEKVSLVHARSRAPAFSALWAAHAAKVPFIATYHGVYNAKSSLKRWYNAVMTKGDLVIANSEFTRAHVIAEHGIDPDKVVAIPRGVDLKRFEPGMVSPSRVEALREAWGIGPNERRLKVLLAGRLTRWKGQALLIEARPLLKARGLGDRFLFLLAGDDQGRKDYRAELEARSPPTAWRTRCASSVIATTCRPPIWSPTSPSPPRWSPRPSAARPSSRR
jgi:glycosyltransferase involved in cell wall biosynthesis